MLGDSPMRNLDYDLDSLPRLDNFNMIPKSSEVYQLPSEFALLGDLDLDDIFITCTSLRAGSDLVAEFNY